MQNSNTVFPNFSLLMSVYIKERPEYLDEALSSIDTQTVFPTEIILVEDGPLTQDLNDVVKKYQKLWQDKFKIIKLPINSGLGPALQEGTKYVTTDWIARMDTDDVCVKNRFEVQLREVAKYPDYAVIGGQVDEFMGTIDNIVGKRKVPLSQKDIYNYIKFRNPFNHPTVIINKNKLLEVGGYTASDRLEDYNLWVKFVKDKNYLKNLDIVLVHMRVSDNLYKRRGGFKYLLNYIKMKRLWRKEGVGNIWSTIVSDTLMLGNTIIPSTVRKKIYNYYLHKKENK